MERDYNKRYRTGLATTSIVDGRIINIQCLVCKVCVKAEHDLDVECDQSCHVRVKLNSTFAAQHRESAKALLAVAPASASYLLSCSPALTPPHPLSSFANWPKDWSPVVASSLRSASLHLHTSTQPPCKADIACTYARKDCTLPVERTPLQDRPP